VKAVPMELMLDWLREMLMDKRKAEKILLD